MHAKLSYAVANPVRIWIEIEGAGAMLECSGVELGPHRGRAVVAPTELDALAADLRAIVDGAAGESLAGPMLTIDIDLHGVRIEHHGPGDARSAAIAARLTTFAKSLLRSATWRPAAASQSGVLIAGFLVLFIGLAILISYALRG